MPEKKNYIQGNEEKKKLIELTNKYSNKNIIKR